MSHVRASMTSASGTSSIVLTLFIRHVAPVDTVSLTSTPSDLSLSDRDWTDCLLPIPLQSDAQVEQAQITTDLPFNESRNSG